MRIVFMGTPEFAVPSLKALIQNRYEIAGVFTQPDRPKGRGNKLTFSPVKAAAFEAGLPVFQPEKIRRDATEILRDLRPDLCVTAAFGQILSQEILDIPPLGSINVHASLLPRHRGPAPVAHAIMCGDKETGVTTMFMDAGIDTGDILLQQKTDIRACETCGELTTRLAQIGADLLILTIRELENGTLIRIPQNEHEMSYDPMLDKSMGNIDFSDSADAVCGKINGLNPWPCVTVPLGGDRLKLLRAVKTFGTGRYGTVTEADPKKGLIIACGSDAVRITEIQAPGGKKMEAGDYLRGHAIMTGVSLNEDKK